MCRQLDNDRNGLVISFDPVHAGDSLETPLENAAACSDGVDNDDAA